MAPLGAAAVCLILLTASSLSVCRGEATFNAALVDTMNSSNVFGTVEATVSDGEWIWSMDTLVPGIAAEISDRRGNADDPLFRPLVSLIDEPESDRVVNGTFGSDDVMTENAPDLFKNASIPAAKALGGHMCMGHIFAVVNGTDDETYIGAMTFTGEGDCYEATNTMSMGAKHSGSMNMDMEGEDMDMDMDMEGEDMDMEGEDMGDMKSQEPSGTRMFGIFTPITMIVSTLVLVSMVV